VKKRCICLAVAVLLLPFQAAVADMSWYLGAGGGLTVLRTSDFASASGLNSGLGTGDRAGSNEFNDSPFGWQVYGGAMFTENFGLVLKYSDSGKGKDRWNGFTEIDPDGPDVMGCCPEPPVTTNYDFVGEMQMDGFTIYAIQTVPLGDKFAYGIEVGWTKQDIEFTWDSTSNPSTPNSGIVKTDASGFAFGALMRYQFLKHVAVSTEFEWLLIDFGDLIDRPIKLSVNLEVHF